MLLMRTNTKTSKRIEKMFPDPVFDAVVERMTRKGKGFFIISCGALIHPQNAVMNCYSIMFDGFSQYKFELTMDGFKLAEIRNTHWLTLPLTVGITYKQDELAEIIKNSP
jgi:hypothetical protein